jgi:ribosome-binding protein aMBF1 (putative translation factor)|tara:strand:+ start:657 stop:914 length:258 start_codon:yes stop_codon:yes gene_type:complete
MPLFHPLQEDITKLSEEDLSKRIRELTSKIMSARRFSRNPDLQNQIQNALNTYREELRTRRIKEAQDRFKKSRGEPELGDLVNIE